ncbi:hypothetical protein FJY90_04995 [Candidatus Gottesmanbacteria bacterium]|nr:hypothetical protein [Candidatus Gottesmanbacteria bacterium]
MWLIKRLYKSQFVRGSLLIFIVSNVVSFGNFLFNLSMGRLLGPRTYGDLGAILSFFVFLSVPLSIINLLVTKTVSVYWGKKNYGAILSLFKYFTPRLFLLGIAVCTILILTSSSLGGFLCLDNLFPLVLAFLMFVLGGLSTLNKAILQGSLFFFYLTVSAITEVVLKLVIAIFLVVINFGLNGAMFGFLASGIAGYLLTRVQLGQVFKKAQKKRRFNLSRKLLKASIPIIIMSLTLIAFVNTDIILVRHFFPADISGEYVALSTMGKIIYYGVGPVISVMFPVISTRVISGLPYILPLLGTLVMSLGLSVILIFAYFLFPRFIVGILFGSKFYGVVPYLGLFSFFIAIYSLDSILTYYLLSISYYRPVFLLFPIALLQGILILIFHSSLTEVIWVNIASSLLYLVIILFFVIKKEYRWFSMNLFRIFPRDIYET